MYRIDNGFEDREGHQAPPTLPEEENAQRSIEEMEGVRTVGAETFRMRRWASRYPNLLEFPNRADDLVEIGPVAGIELGVKEFAIGANFKGAAAGWNQGQRFDAFAEVENLRRQTDSLGRVVSNHAVFDRHLGFHLELLSKNQAIGTSKRGQDSVEAPK